MNKKISLIPALFLTLHLIPTTLFAGELKSREEKALILTQEMLKDPEKRNEIIQKHPQGQAADQKVKEIAGSPENEAAIYELASEVFGNVMKEAGGDVAKAQEILNAGLKDPEAFANKWTPEQKEKLHGIAEKTPATTESKTFKGYKKK